MTAWNKIFKIRFETIPVLFQKPSHLNTLMRDLMCVFVIWGFVKIHVICKNILYIRKLKSNQIAFIDNHNWLTMASFLEHPCFVSKKWQTTDLNWFKKNTYAGFTWRETEIMIAQNDYLARKSRPTEIQTMNQSTVCICHVPFMNYLYINHHQPAGDISPDMRLYQHSDKLKILVLEFWVFHKICSAHGDDGTSPKTTSHLPVDIQQRLNWH